MCAQPSSHPDLSPFAQAHQERETALERFIADQERAFEEKEREGLDTLVQRKVDLESQVRPLSRGPLPTRAVCEGQRGHPEL